MSITGLIKKEYKGKLYMLTNNGVWVLKENYKLGTIIKQWAYIVKDVEFEEAIKVFNRRTKSKLSISNL